VSRRRRYLAAFFGSLAGTAATVVTILYVLGHGGGFKGAGGTLGNPGGGSSGSVANLWMDSNGGTCTRSATHVAYVDADACGSLNAMYLAATSCTDLGLIKAGSYAGETIAKVTTGCRANTNTVFPLTEIARGSICASACVRFDSAPSEQVTFTGQVRIGASHLWISDVSTTRNIGDGLGFQVQPDGDTGWGSDEIKLTHITEQHEGIVCATNVLSQWNDVGVSWGQSNGHIQALTSCNTIPRFITRDHDWFHDPHSYCSNITPSNCGGGTPPGGYQDCGTRGLGNGPDGGCDLHIDCIHDGSWGDVHYTNDVLSGCLTISYFADDWPNARPAVSANNPRCCQNGEYKNNVFYKPYGSVTMDMSSSGSQAAPWPSAFKNLTFTHNVIVGTVYWGSCLRNVGGVSSATTITAAMDATQTTVAVSSSANYPGGSGGISSQNYRVLVGSEKMLVTAGQGTSTWTVTRGIESTTAAIHSSGAVIKEPYCPDDYASVLGNGDGTASVVGTASSSVLANNIIDEASPFCGLRSGGASGPGAPSVFNSALTNEQGQTVSPSDCPGSGNFAPTGGHGGYDSVITTYLTPWDYLSPTNAFNYYKEPAAAATINAGNGTYCTAFDLTGLIARPVGAQCDSSADER